MKKFVYTLFLSILFSCCYKADYHGTWYSPNGLVRIDFRDNGNYTGKTIGQVYEGTWYQVDNSIILEDSTVLQIESNKLTLLGHKLNRTKPQTTIERGFIMSGKKFFWTFQRENETLFDTISFGKTTYHSSHSNNDFGYRLVEHDNMFFLTSDHLSNIVESFTLIKHDKEEKLVLEYYDPHKKTHKIFEWLKL